MKLMTGQLRPSKGQVRVLGEPIWGNPALYQRIGFCPEQDAFYDRMTGREWVTALAGLHGFDERTAADAAARAIEAVELTDAADRKIGSYSKGMRQRIKLAQAIAHEPELLILDEPLSGMDPLMRRRTVRQIKEWARGGTSVLVSSHILHEVEAMTSNIVLDQQRPHRRRRRRAPDPRPDRRAPAHRVDPHQSAARRRARAARRRRAW